MLRKHLETGAARPRSRRTAVQPPRNYDPLAA
jgi:hypothetical protein